MYVLLLVKLYYGDFDGIDSVEDFVGRFIIVLCEVSYDGYLEICYVEQVVLVQVLG